MGLLRRCVAEMVGTFILVFFGTGAVASAVYIGAQVGLWQVAVVWGVGLALGIYATAAVSGAHLNPAVTLAMALWRRDSFPGRWLLPYWAGQLAGAVLAGAVILAIFNPIIREFEAANGLIRGMPGSQLSAMAFGEYFPNPDAFGTDAAAFAIVGVGAAFLVEALGTALLVMMVFAATDPKNEGVIRGLTPLVIGATLAALLSLLAPLTQAGLNPARDFGPRLISLMAGWGDIAIPGPRSGFWVYLLAPLVGGPIGATIYQLLAANLPRRRKKEAPKATGPAS